MADSGGQRNTRSEVRSATSSPACRDRGCGRFRPDGADGGANFEGKTSTGVRGSVLGRRGDTMLMRPLGTALEGDGPAPEGPPRRRWTACTTARAARRVRLASWWASSTAHSRAALRHFGGPGGRRDSATSLVRRLHRPVLATGRPSTTTASIRSSCRHGLGRGGAAPRAYALLRRNPQARASSPAATATLATAAHTRSSAA